MKFLVVDTYKIEKGRHVKATTKEYGMTKSKHPKHWKAQHGQHTVKGYLRFLMLDILQ
ncbi:hypothetical protein AMTR_s00209p00033700, partial [Amborella trichopoda]